MVYFYVKGKEERVPCYLLRSTNLFQDLNRKFDPLKVSYDDEKIDSLTVSTLFFWNSGKKTIRNADIAQNDPLVLKMKDGYKILNVKILNASDNKNSYKVELSPDSLSTKLMFDYIDKDEGMIVQITHTGSSSNDLEFSGTIIGAKKLNHKKTTLAQNFSISFDPFAILGFSAKSTKKSEKFSRHLKASLLFLTGITYMAIPIIDTLSLIDTNKSQPTPAVILYIFFIGGIFFSLMGISELKRKIPKSFQMFYDEIEF